MNEPAQKLQATPLNLPVEELDEVADDEVVIDEELVSLPEEIAATLSDPMFEYYINDIGERQNIPEEKWGYLSAVTRLLLEGELPPVKYVDALSQYLEVSRATASYIAQEMNKDLFSPIKGQLVTIQNVKAKPALITSNKVGLTPAPVPTPVPVPPKNTPSVVAALGTTPPAPREPVIRDPAQPVRSDWGWHGKKNEVTGKVEFQHEGELETTQKPLAPQSKEVNTAGTAHIGSVFEQKLGGVFRVKGDSTEYRGTPTPVPHSDESTALHVPMKPSQRAIPPVRPFTPPQG